MVSLAVSLPLSFDTPEFRTDIVPEAGDFTAGCLLRLDGFGDVPAHMDFRNGMVFSCESGYYDGFRLFFEEPEMFRPVFEMGRAEGAVQLKPPSGVSTGAWHHVAISWQSVDTAAKTGVMRLFADGSLLCESPADRPAPILKGAPIRIGYVDYGVGSLRMEARHFFYETRAMTETEVRAAALASTAGLEEPTKRLRQSLDVAQKVADLPEDKLCAFATNCVPSDWGMPEPPAARSPEKTAARVAAAEAEQTRRLDAADAAHTFVLPSGPDIDAATELEKALEKVAALRHSGDSAPARIELVAGHYSFSHTVRIVGHEYDNLAIVATKNGKEESGMLDGGRVISLSEFQPVQDPEILRRLPNDEARRSVRCLPVPGMPPVARPYGVGFDDRHGVLVAGRLTQEKDIPSQILPCAYWPEDGTYADGMADATGAISAPGLDAERLARWASAPAPLAHGYWKYLWADAALPIRIEGDALRLMQDHCYGLGETPRFRVENLLEELDSPGEWVLENGILYMRPPSDCMSVGIPLLDEPFLRIEDCRNMTLDHLSFLRSAADGVAVKNSPGTRLSHCRFWTIGGTALVLENCPDAALMDSTIAFTGHGGCYASAGNRDTLEAGNLTVSGCSFAGMGLVTRTYTPSVRLEGCGNMVRDSLFNGTSSSAIRLEGNDHVIETCTFDQTVQESDDQGSIDIWGDPTYRGNIIRHNLFQHVGGEGRSDCGRAGVRFDDMISGNLVYGNVFEDSARGGMGGVVIHGGQHNRVFGNFFVDCLAGVVFNPWGKERWGRQLATDETQGKTRGRVDSPVYLQAYPEMVRLHEDVDVNTVYGNVFLRTNPMFRNKRGFVEEFGNVAR